MSRSIRFRSISFSILVISAIRDLFLLAALELKGRSTVHYTYRDSVVIMPWIDSWDFKGPKVLPEHATLPVPDNVIPLDPHRKTKELKSRR